MFFMIYYFLLEKNRIYTKYNKVRVGEYIMILCVSTSYRVTVNANVDC